MPRKPPVAPIRAFELIKPGFLTTLQDLGRPGFQRFGVSPAGAMDNLALRVANRLVGNADGCAALEITVQGPDLTVLHDCLVAMTGGNLSPSLESEPVPLWRSVRLNKGQVLSFGERISGARSYLSIAGGFAIPEVLGSRSTDLQAQFGGLEGRRLLRGDILFQNGPGRPSKRLRGVVPDILNCYSDPFYLGVLEGPQAHLVSSASMQQFLASEYVVTPASNRVGYRLQGPPISAVQSEIISDAVPLGAIQLLPNGQPVLLMADRQTVGGYPKIATLISADIPKAAQLAIGDRAQFRTVTLDEAQDLLSAQERIIENSVVDVD